MRKIQNINQKEEEKNVHYFFKSVLNGEKLKYGCEKKNKGGESHPNTFANFLIFVPYREQWATFRHVKNMKQYFRQVIWRTDNIGTECIHMR